MAKTDLPAKSWDKPAHQCYLGCRGVKRDRVSHDFSEIETQEYLRCMASPQYFARNYIKVISIDHGLVDFNLWAYQDKMYDHFMAYRFTVVLAPRQSGKSISACVFLLWSAVFKPETIIAVLANKASTSREMLARISLALENLPFFLQPGCRSLNKGSITFSNNSKILAAATTGASIRGLAIAILYLDEFAFVQDAATFYTSTYPVITSGKNSRVIITSTPNGVGNLFHKIWESALQGTSEYKPFRVHWRDVPGRDETWKKQTISNTSELQFKQEFEVEFIGSSATLINVETLLGLKSGAPLSIVDDCRIYEKPDKKKTYVLVADTAKGRGQDYSAFAVIDITEKPFKVVAVYRSNLISPLLFPNVIQKYGKMYNEAYLIIENNDAGVVVANALYYDLEYENMYLESTVSADGVGLNQNKKTKRIGCSNLKDMLEGGMLLVTDMNMIAELSTFEADGDSFAASKGNHDDLVMVLVMFAFFVATTAFAEMSSVNLKATLYHEKITAMMDELAPVGIFSAVEEAKPKFEKTSDGLIWETDDVQLARNSRW